jgi:hypothetical protein
VPPQTHLAEGYELLYTPHVANLDLWKTSGHYDFYREGMFDQMDVEGEQYQIKPMNCPFHCLVYKDSMRSYRDLPIRYADVCIGDRCDISTGAASVFHCYLLSESHKSSSCWSIVPAATHP